MKRLLLSAIVLSYVIIASGCRKFCKDYVFTISRTDYRGPELRTDGYFFNSGEEHTSIYYFFNNGVFYSTNAATEEDASSGNFEPPDTGESVQYRWGVFSIDGQHLKIERWGASYSCFTGFIQTGTILNDSTFKITHYETIKGEKRVIESKDVEWVFKFRPAAKPDSTNTFIKE